MKLIVFIIVLFLMFLKTFAFVTYGDCFGKLSKEQPFLFIKDSQFNN